MAKLTANISVSLDGFVAGPNDNPEQGLGEGGERLHDWMFGLESWRREHGLEGGEASQAANSLGDIFANAGAIIIGRRMFDLGEKPWGDPPPFHRPVFIVTHRAHERLDKAGGTSYIFMTDGIDSALRQAQAAAGDKDVTVGGGANIIQQYLNAGLLDEIQLHLVPVMLGGGTRLFDGMKPRELETLQTIDAGGATHLKFRVVK